MATPSLSAPAGYMIFEIIRHDGRDFSFVSVSTSSTSLSPLSRRNTISTHIKSMRASPLGPVNVLGLARRILARFLQTFNSKVHGDPIVHPQPGQYLCHQSALFGRREGVRYDIAHDTVESLSCWSASGTISLVAPTASPLSVACTGGVGKL